MKWLCYIWNGWLFEFGTNEIFVTHPLNKDIYKIEVEPFSEVPFRIQLLEKGK